MYKLLHLSAACDTAGHHILLQRLEILLHITETALAWLMFYRSLFVRAINKSSLPTRVSYGVQQGSMLGPVIFISYVLPLGTFMKKHLVNVYCYADDTCIYQ